MHASRPAVSLFVALLLLALPVSAEVYRWTDESGRTHFDDDVTHVPEGQRDSARVFQMKARPADQPGLKTDGSTQGAFAAGLARELGLQTVATQDPASLLSLVGIYPSTGWYPNAPLSPAVVQEVVTATRAAARARRLAQPEAGAEAAVLRIASSLGVATPPPTARPEPAPPPIVIAPNIVVEAPPATVVVQNIQPAPQTVLSNYPTFAFGIPFAPLGPVPIGPAPSRIVPLSDPGGRLHGPLITPLRPGPFMRPSGP
jgi:hypothetical protein